MRLKYMDLEIVSIYIGMVAWTPRGALGVSFWREGSPHLRGVRLLRKVVQTMELLSFAWWVLVILYLVNFLLNWWNDRDRK
ncbi:MAG: hypothetical protein WHX93_02290 [bacterium]